MVTCAKALGLLSAVSGAAGTCSLYLGTFGFEMPGLFNRSNDEVMQASARNKRRLILQPLGLFLLLVSFVLAGISILWQ
jgi:hypothetical protein